MTKLFLLVIVSSLALCQGQRRHEQKPLGRPLGAAPDSDQISISTKDLEAFIEEKMKKWYVPGMTVGILEGNKTWFKAFGYADIESSKPMTTDALFYCGSTTKSLTAAALSLLVDSPDHAVQWDTPVSQLLREDFVLTDPWATEHITITDALSHRTGYPRHDLSMDLPSARDLARNFRNLPMAAEPRTKFLYNNMMYGVMGYLIEILSAMPLVGFLRERLWLPWGMHDTFFGLEDLRAAGRAGDMPSEYWYINDTDSYVKLPHANFMADAGAGATISNVHDYVRYMRVMMDEAGPVSKANHAMLKQPHNILFASDPLWTGPVWYGLGWEAGVVQNEKVYFHGGQVNMFNINMLMIPNRKFAIVTMLNTFSLAQELVVWRVMYDYFNVSADQRFDIERRGAAGAAIQDYLLQKCRSLTYPSAPDPPVPFDLPLADFAGTYVNAGYGALKLELDCKPPPAPADSPASPTTDDDGCILVSVSGADENTVGITLRVMFEHVTGDYWLGWAMIEQLERAGYGRPLRCMRAQFKVDDKGVISSFGLDIRQEELDTPLVWYDRTEASGNRSFATMSGLWKQPFGAMRW